MNPKSQQEKCCFECVEAGFGEGELGCAKKSCPCHQPPTEEPARVGSGWIDPTEVSQSEGWEKKYTTSAMLAETVREGELVVPLNSALWLTRLLLSTLVKEMEKKEVVFPSVDVYVEMVKKGNHDDMYEHGFRAGISAAVEVVNRLMK